MQRLLTLIIVFFAAVSISAQTDWSAGRRPTVLFDSKNVELQTGLYPTYYRTEAATDDMRWVQLHAATIDSFWQRSGDSVLNVLSQLSGVEWNEQGISVVLLRYYPTVGNAEPMILPIGGLRVGSLTEAIPPGLPTHLNLIYQLANRLLLGASKTRSDASYGLTNHPLAQPGPYYRDLLAFHLAYSTAKVVLGPDSALAAFQDPFWKRNLPCRELYEQYLLGIWQLSEEKPLVGWLAKEPYDSRLMQAISPLVDMTEAEARRQTVEGLPEKGLLGFSVRINDNNLLVVDQIDNTRLAHKAGLRAGDVVNRVAGIRPRTHKELMEMILNGLDRGSVSVQVSRAGKSETVMIRK
jgi:hypothetical protein